MLQTRLGTLRLLRGTEVFACDIVHVVLCSTGSVGCEGVVRTWSFEVIRDW